MRLSQLVTLMIIGFLVAFAVFACVIAGAGIGTGAVR